MLSWLTIEEILHSNTIWRFDQRFFWPDQVYGKQKMRNATFNRFSIVLNEQISRLANILSIQKCWFLSSLIPPNSDLYWVYSVDSWTLTSANNPSLMLATLSLTTFARRFFGTKLLSPKDPESQSFVGMMQSTELARYLRSLL